MNYTSTQLAEIAKRYCQSVGKVWADFSTQGQTEEIDKVASLFAIAALVVPPVIAPALAVAAAPVAKRIVAPAIHGFMQRIANRPAPAPVVDKPRAVSAPLPKALFPAQRAPVAPVVAVKKGS
jgi:hypothetical protein